MKNEGGRRSSLGRALAAPIYANHTLVRAGMLWQHDVFLSVRAGFCCEGCEEQGFCDLRMWVMKLMGRSAVGRWLVSVELNYFPNILTKLSSDSD